MFENSDIERMYFKIDPSVIVAYCDKRKDLTITETEIEENASGNITENFQNIIDAYDDVLYYLFSPSEAYDDRMIFHTDANGHVYDVEFM